MDLLELTKQAVAANDRRSRELARMSPKDRERAIEAWAEQLAREAAKWDD